MSTIKVTAEVKQEIERYKQFMLAHEHTTQTALGYSTYLSRYLRKKPPDESVPLQESITAFLESQRTSIPPPSFKGCRAALYLYFKMATGESFPKRKQTNQNPEIELVLNQFYAHSTNIKRIQPSTAIGDISFVRHFLEHVSHDMSCRIESITAHEIRDFVVQKLTHLSDSSKGSAATAIRNFFRYRKFEGFPVHESIFLIPLFPAVWKNSTFPTTIDKDVFDALSEVPNQNTPTGNPAL